MEKWNPGPIPAVLMPPGSAAGPIVAHQDEPEFVTSDEFSQRMSEADP